MNRSIIAGLVFSLLSFGCAVKSKKLQNVIDEKLVETTNSSKQYQKGTSNLDITLRINKEISLVTNCEQISSSFVPAFFYWGWNSEINCEIGREYLEEHLKREMIAKIEDEGLHSYFQDKKIIIDINAIPTKFKFQDKGNVIYLVIAYSMAQKRYFAPELTDFKGTYKIVDKDNNVITENNFEKPLTLKSQTSNTKSTKKLSWQYLENYNVEINRFVKIIFNDMNEKIQR